MNSLSIGRGAATARTLRVWSTAMLATLILAACGGGGGGDDPAPPPQNPPPSNPPPAAPTNAAPTANAGTDQNVELPTDNAPLTGTATDDSLPTGSSLAYTWELVTGPPGPNNSPGVVFSSTNTAATTARFAGGVGDYTLRLNASDGALTGSDTVIVSVKTNPNAYPTAGAAGWATATPADENMNVALLDQARDYSIDKARGFPESGFIVRHGRVVYTWGDVNQTYEMKSTTKSVGGLALLLALDEGKLALTDKASARLPVFGTDPAVTIGPAVTTGTLAEISLLQLATHTSGLSKSDTAGTLVLNSNPGSTWSYSDQGLNWLADALTTTYAQDLSTLMFSRVYTTLGIGANDLRWRVNQYRSADLSVNGTPTPRRELASGIDANVHAMARIGQLMLRKGVWGNDLILSNSIVAKAHAVQPEIDGAVIANPVDFPAATDNYGILWWTNANGQISGVPTEAFWSWGLHDTLIIVVPSLDLVIARAGDRGWRAANDIWNADYSVLAPFLQPIVQSVTP